jgi:hypothetical protein
VKELVQSGASKSGGTVKFKCPACEREGHPNNENAVFFVYTKSWLCERTRGTDAAREHWTSIVEQLRLPPA